MLFTPALSALGAGVLAKRNSFVKEKYNVLSILSPPGAIFKWEFT